MKTDLKNNKLLFVSNTSESIYNFRLNLLKNVKKNGYKVFIISSSDDSSEKLREEDFVLYNVEFDRKGVNPFKELKIMFSLVKIYKEIEPSLIFHYTIKPNIFGVIAARICSFKTIAVTTGLGFVFVNRESIISKIAKRLYKISFKFAEEVWFLNKHDKDIFIDENLVEPEKADILNGEGIDTNHFKPVNIESNNQKVKFTLISRLLWDKGIGEFVEAAEKILSDNNEVEFNILGPFDENYPNYIDKNTLDNWVKKGIINYMGYMDDVREIIAQSDCIVLPSYREGIPMTLMEAASMAKPVIATDVPGCKDVVIDGYNGLLCKVKNSTDLADKMIRMYNMSKKERIIMGENGRSYMIEKYDCEIVNKKYIETIKKYLNS